MKRLVFAVAILSATLFAARPAAHAERARAARSTLDPVRARAEGTLRGLVTQAERRDRSLSSVGLFTGMFNLLRANVGLEKLDVLLDVAAELQDRNPESRTYGNFRWYARDGFVMDGNAVDFCMQEGSLIARDYRDRLTPALRARDPGEHQPPRA